MAEGAVIISRADVQPSRLPPDLCQVLQAPPPSHTVQEKLRTHPFFKTCSEYEIAELAAILSDETKLKERFFSHILEASTRTLQQTIREAERISTGGSHLTQQEARVASERAEDRFANVCSLPMKLVLTRIGEGGSSKGKAAMLANCKTGCVFASCMKFPFGAFHAAVMVGNVFLEWDASSLVIPTFKQVTPVFQASLDIYSYWNRFTSRYKQHMRETLGEEPDYNNQAEVMLIINNEKEEVINKLACEIVRYNTCHSYRLCDCNCQHFVLQVMRTLRVFDPPKFAGRLKRYFERLCAGKRDDPQRKFRSHSELDRYVRRKLGTLDQNEVDYLLCIYSDFHRAGRKDGGQLADCVGGCQMGELEELMTRNRHLQHKFT